MGWKEGLTKFVCASVCGAIGVGTVVAGGVMFAPCGLAVFVVVEGTYAVTAAGVGAMATAGLTGATAGAQVGGAINGYAERTK